MRTKGFVYIFTLKSDRNVYYNSKDDSYAVEYDYAQLLEPSELEMMEILRHIAEVAMTAWGNLFSNK